MSIFRTVELSCPACESVFEFELVFSVSADRRPDLREAILDGSFQRQACPACGTPFRVDPEFTYMDIRRGQYIGVWPVALRERWQACAAKTREVFDATLGSGAGPEAQRIGGRLTPRAVFGWPALNEKILAAEAGIDDRTLEVAKIAVLRSGEELPLPGAQEFRLIGLPEGDLLLAWVQAGSERRGDALRVPRTLIADIESERERWQAAYDSLGEGPVTDFQRELLAAD